MIHLFKGLQVVTLTLTSAETGVLFVVTGGTHDCPLPGYCRAVDELIYQTAVAQLAF